MSKDTCILLFSRSAASESKHKQLVKAEKKNERVHHALYSRVLRVAQSTGLPLIKVDERSQGRGTFGEKFTNALTIAFAGFEHVIVVGSDCPNLCKEDILFAHRELQEGRQCLGPSMDGGFYLLGISKAFFHRGLVDLAWQTDQLHADVCAYFDELGVTVGCLARKQDIDTATQFNVIAQFLSTIIDFAFLNESTLGAPASINIISPKEYLYLKGLPYRGPPSMHLAA